MNALKVYIVSYSHWFALNLKKEDAKKILNSNYFWMNNVARAEFSVESNNIIAIDTCSMKKSNWKSR